MGVIDVQPGAVREDEIGEAELLVRQLRRVRLSPRHVIAPGIAQRMLLVEVPPRATAPIPHGDTGVRRHHGRRRRHGIDVRMPGHADAVLRLDAHHTMDAHGRTGLITGSEVLAGVGDVVDQPPGLGALLALDEGADEDDALALLARDACPVIRIRGVGQVLVLAELIHARGE